MEFRLPTFDGRGGHQSRCSAGAKSRGFTYIGILLAIALIGMALSGIGVVWSTEVRRAKEVELMFVGRAIRRAIASYYNATPTGVHQYPRQLDELLGDKRNGAQVRHLRRIYADPMTGLADWNEIVLADGSIIGVASRAEGVPIKRSNFGPWENAFEDAICYCDWKYVYLPQLVSEITNAP